MFMKLTFKIWLASNSTMSNRCTTLQTANSPKPRAGDRKAGQNTIDAGGFCPTFTIRYI